MALDSKRIVIFHAAAIGDAVLATPCAVALKNNFAGSHITYVTHSSLVPLLKLCAAIDDFKTYTKGDSTSSVRSQLAALKPDLLVDLSGSLKSFMQTALVAGKVLHYKKQSASTKTNILHATENYLSTLNPLNLKLPARSFPTLAPELSVIEKIRSQYDAGQPLLAFVPGVGNLRPYRAWPEQKWIDLARHIGQDGQFSIVLVGGPDDLPTCERIQQVLGSTCVNLAGRLALAETAALLSICKATVSGDTGPAHISVAVGTPVVGLYGPTLVARSGPFGGANPTIDAGQSCLCRGRKDCELTGPGRAGQCMEGISEESVYAALSRL